MTRRSIPALLTVLALVLAACGGDETTSSGDATTEAAAGTDEEPTADDGDGLPNACPAEGCQIFIDDAVLDGSGELQLTFRANFGPEFERNHIHVFWDSQEPGAVSSDYDAKGFSVQGDWHPTDDYPAYLTQAEASITAAARGDSTTICVTAADTDHAVIDAGIFACRDVADLVS